MLAVVALVGLGVVMVFNVSYFFGHDHFGDPLLFFRKHLLSIGLGLCAGVVTSRLSSDAYRRLAYPLLLGVLVALVLVLVPGIGLMRSGARRWIHLGPLTLQPSEAAKFALVLYLARSLAKKGSRVREFKLGVAPHCVVALAIAGLVLLEHDFGTVALAVGLLVLMLFAAGVRLWHLAGLALTTVPLLGLAVAVAPYRMKRLAAFLSPDRDPLGMGHQLRQSLIGFGSGGLWGAGLGESQQKMFFLPAAHTDFIFSVIGEELGLIGALFVIGLFAVIALRGFRIAFRHPDEFGSLLAFGTTLLLVLQGAINMAVVLGCLPTKGLTLPFVSYGGSAMIAVLAETGVLLALSREAG